MPFEPPTPDEAVRTVSDLVARIQGALRDGFQDVGVEGEISNLKLPSSGHVYLTLKDEYAQLRAVMWRSVADRYRGRLADGQHVVARGTLTIYEPRGDLQMVISSIRLTGEGALMQAFEALKRRLALEGLFDPARKRPLMPIPRTIGIVTSNTGAVIRDMLTIFARRYPTVRIVVAPVRVQGEGAAEEIAAAIRRFNRLDPSHEQRPDVLIVGRGGGSLEDLWAFNEEIVARSIHASGIPVVSAVGHETDTTISDLVADVRAGTPSMAAEMVVPSILDLESALQGRLQQAEHRIHRLLDRLRHRLEGAVRNQRFHQPGQRIQRLAQRNDELTMRMDRAMELNLRRTGDRTGALVDRLRALDPLRPLAGGFALVERGSHVVRSASRLSPGDPVRLRFHDGHADATIGQVESTGG